VQRTVSNVEILVNHSILGGIPRRIIERLCSRSTTRRVKCGTVIFAKGDAGTELIAVLVGRVKISVSTPDGREGVLNVVRAGEVFGEIALLDGRPRTADAIAMSDCELLTIERRDFLPLIHEQPEVALKLIEILCERLRRTSEQVEDVMFLNVRPRMAKLVLRLLNDAEGSRRILITQRELSEMLGMSRESINKQLRAWAQAKWVRLERGGVVVLQPGALADIAERRE
jgi:CRP/FNR family transcriptional regulator, cyclic AMP receptor protein